MREEKEKNVCANKEGMIEYDNLTACKSKAIEESLNQTGVTCTFHWCQKRNEGHLSSRSGVGGLTTP